MEESYIIWEDCYGLYELLDFSLQDREKNIGKVSVAGFSGSPEYGASQKWLWQDRLVKGENLLDTNIPVPCYYQNKEKRIVRTQCLFQFFSF